MDRIERIKELVQKLNTYSYEYYTLGTPSIADETYDMLYDELVKLEIDTGFKLSQSPTRKVGNVILSKLQKSTHKYPMLSLDKIKYKDLDKLYDWIGNKDTVAMLKLDGLTIDLTYIEGKLTKAESRGNGFEGEDITHNAQVFSNIPLTIPYEDNEVHISGEAVIDYDTFDKINSKLPIDKRYKNPRNLCSGSVRQLDSKICKSRNVKFYGYIVEGINFSSKIYQLKFIENQGFDVVSYTHILHKDSKNRIPSTIDTLKQLANDKGLPIDGLVFMYDDIEYGKSLGITSHHPLHSIALKFTEDIEITKLKNVEWQVGRTGLITPVAEFEDVELCGTTVNRASLHNISILKNLQLGIGDEISVIKANEIIPQVVDNLTKSNDIQIPSVCSCCGHPTEIKCDKESEVLYCTNDNCTAKLIQKLVHYCSRNAMNIEGLSEKTLEKFIELGFINDITDIYSLHEYKDRIVKLEGFGIKSYQKLISAIEKSKTCKLESLIFGLGIPNVGKSTAKDICNYFNNDWYYVINCSKPELLKIKDVGNVVANSVIDFFENSDNLVFVCKLKEILKFETNEPKQQIDGVLQGKSYYLTGTFEFAKKAELKQLVESNGGIFAEKFNKQIDGLVIGKLKGSSKDKKAIEWGIPVISEDEFMNMVNHN